MIRIGGFLSCVFVCGQALKKPAARDGSLSFFSLSSRRKGCRIVSGIGPHPGFFLRRACVEEAWLRFSRSETAAYTVKFLCLLFVVVAVS